MPTACRFLITIFSSLVNRFSCVYYLQMEGNLHISWMCVAANIWYNWANTQYWEFTFAYINISTRQTEKEKGKNHWMVIHILFLHVYRLRLMCTCISVYIYKGNGLFWDLSGAHTIGKAVTYIDIVCCHVVVYEIADAVHMKR